MTDDTLAKQRFFVISALRLLSAVLLILGLVVLAGKTTIDPRIGGVLAVLGLLEFVLLPPFLARKWRTPSQ